MNSSSKKKKVIHFHNGSGGGVLSVISNLLLYKQHSEIENQVIYTINREQTKEFLKPGLNGASRETIFYYSSKWNFNYTIKKLAKLLPDADSIIVAHDWLELGMVSHLALPNPVVFFVHGNYEYYFNLAQKHEKSIDQFFSVADSINKKISSLLPHRITDCHYIRFPVREKTPVEIKFPKSASIVFIGRCDEGKGYNLLPQIALLLKEKNIFLIWHIIGEKKDHIELNWPSGVDIIHYGLLENEKVMSLLGSMKYLVLPSLAEGMPVNVIEAMKSGAVPIVNDLPGGLEELVTNGETGFSIKGNNPSGFAEAIEYLEQRPDLYVETSEKAMKRSTEWFNPVKNTAEIESYFLKLFTNTRSKKVKEKIYGSRLDRAWIPNWVVYFIRS